MKKIEDYLHLYLGCECQFNGETAILHSASIWKEGQAVFINNEVQPCDLHIHDLKLILRELSSMTEEEKQEMRVIDRKYNSSLNLLPEIRQSHMIQLHYTGKAAEITRYLLSKGFDLFNLIPEGLAISAPTQLTNALKNKEYI